MGRQKSNSADKFPWEDYFNENQVNFDHASEVCRDTYTGADMVRKAANLLGYKDTSGTKDENCQKINKQVTILRERIQKIKNEEEKERARQTYIEYLKHSLMNKVDKSEIPVPSKPALPNLNVREFTQINERFPNVPDVGKVVMAGTKEVVGVKPTPEEEKKLPTISKVVKEVIEKIKPEVSAKYKFNEIEVMEAQAVIYIDQVSKAGNKASVTEFMNILQIYSSVISPDSQLLNKEKIKEVLKELIARVKVSGIPQQTLQKAADVVTNSLKYVEEKEVVEPPKIVSKPREEIRYPEEKKEVSFVQKPPPIPVRPLPPIPSKYKEQDFLDFIESRGWKRPVTTSRERLCDYILDQFKKEDRQLQKTEDELKEKYEELNRKMELLLDRQEKAVNDLEKLKMQQSKIAPQKFEEKKEKIEEKQQQTKEKIEKARELIKKVEEKQGHIQTQMEKKKEVCFMMKTWLDQDHFDEEQALQDLTCPNDNLCNVDTSQCEEKSIFPKISIKDKKITGNIVTLKKIKTKFEQEEKMKQQVKMTLDQVISTIEDRELAGKLATEYADKIIEDAMNNAVTEEMAMKLVKQGIDEAIQELQEEPGSPPPEMYEEQPVRVIDQTHINLNIPDEEATFEEPVIEEAVDEFSQQESESNLSYVRRLLANDVFERYVEFVRQISIEEFNELFKQVLESDELYGEMFFKMILVPIMRFEQIGMLKTKKQLQDYQKIIDHYKPESEDEDVLISGNMHYDDYIAISGEISRRIKEMEIPITISVETTSTKKKPLLKTIKKKEAPVEKTYVSETLSKPLPVQKSCNTIEITPETDEKTIIANLTCDDGMLCNVETKMCQVPQSDDVIVPITVGDSIINVIGTTNIINTLKQKILDATRRDKVEEEEIKIPVPKKEKLVKTERPTLDDVVKGLKTISGVSSTTMKQSKIKLLEQQAKEKLRRCVEGK